MDNCKDKWYEIDSRQIPEWFDKAKLGIFVHWGIYSVPSYAPTRKEVDITEEAYSEWYGWRLNEGRKRFCDFHRNTYGENFKYEDFAGMWKAELFDPDKWADLFQSCGAKYVVLVSKHHDAFCLWPSYYSWNWNSVDIGPHRDIVGELLAAVEKRGMKKGLYYSLMEWFHPDMRPGIEKKNVEHYATEKMIPQMKELIETYKPSILFTDGEWGYSSEKWHSVDFINWLYNQSSVKDEIVINDRWGNDTRGLHGGYLTSEYGMVNSAAIDEQEARNNLKKHKWEETRSIGSSFAYNRNENIEDYLSAEEIIWLLANTVSRGGNLCLNVAPCADGTISPLIQERLMQLGEWMQINGEGIYESSPAPELDVSENVCATKRDESYYIICKHYSKEPIVIKSNKRFVIGQIKLMGSNAKVNYSQTDNTIIINNPLLYPDELPSGEIHVFKIILQ